MKKAALLSVSDKSGLVEFSRGLVELGYVILSSGGTASFLRGQGIPVTGVEEYTGQPEILDGRVKTLHPKIHGGLLARRDNPEHMEQLKRDDMFQIDVAAINLYPFIQSLKSAAVEDPYKMVELVDVGGPTMIRAASKNFKSVYPVIDPLDYPAVLAALRQPDQSSSELLTFRKELAVKVFTQTAAYDLEIARYFSAVDLQKGSGCVSAEVSTDKRQLAKVSGQVLTLVQNLRYGENPHQRGNFYHVAGAGQQSWQQLQGKELSYNNFLDFDAALRMAAALPNNLPAAVIIKHLNPCGAATGASLLEALERAKQGDPRSHFGGVLAFNQEVGEDVALNIANEFAEIVLAPAFSNAALDCLQKKKNLRVIRFDADSRQLTELRSVQGGVLIQECDPNVSSVADAELVTSRKPSAAELQDLQLAWSLCAHVKSNAITLVKDGMLLASGAGQMSRIDAVEVAFLKTAIHRHVTEGAVAASDAFFPFSDCVERLAKEGIKVIIAPGGAKRDDEVCSVAEDLGLSLLLAPDRHFRH